MSFLANAFPSEKGEKKKNKILKSKRATIAWI